MRATQLTRLAVLEAMDPAQALEHTHGIAALLKYAEAHRPQPWDLPDLVDDPTEPLTGLAKLLYEARRRQERGA